MSSRAFALTVAYDGSEYAGWQIQPNGPTIQQTVSDAVSKVIKQDIQVEGSGRTDAGVHSVGQICSFVTDDWNHSADRLVQAINGYLPRDIVVIESREVVLGFDPIRNATGKRYRYTIRNSRVLDPMRHRYHWWYTRDLNLDLMSEAANHLLGTHDFRAFESIGSERKTSTRTVRSLDVTIQPAMAGSEIWIEIEADGFLYNMVRNIAGALTEVGVDHFSPRWIQGVLDSKERSLFSPTAPARGLCLMEVRYPESCFV